jgi:hypothetical protein
MQTPDRPSWFMVTAMQLAAIGLAARGIGQRAWPHVATDRRLCAANKARLPWSDR